MGQPDPAHRGGRDSARLFDRVAPSRCARIRSRGDRSHGGTGLGILVWPIGRSAALCHRPPRFFYPCARRPFAYPFRRHGDRGHPAALDDSCCAGCSLERGHVAPLRGTPRRDLLYRDEFEQLTALHPQVRAYFTLSQGGADWAGRRGYVQTHVAELWDELSRSASTTRTTEASPHFTCAASSRW